MRAPERLDVMGSAAGLSPAVKALHLGMWAILSAATNLPND